MEMIIFFKGGKGIYSRMQINDIIALIKRGFQSALAFAIQLTKHVSSFDEDTYIGVFVRDKYDQ